MLTLEAGRLKRTFATLVLVGLRGSGLLSKFMLTVFIAKLMSLSDLGLYGLIAVGATIVPGVFGLGVNGPASRSMVGLPTSDAVRLASTRLGITLTLHALITPLTVVLITLLLSEYDARLVVLVALTLFVENIATDINAMLIARFKPTLAAILLFVRSGAWPFVFMILAWFNPTLRTVPVIVECWLASLLCIMTFLVVTVVIKQYWHSFGFDKSAAREMIVRGKNFYMADIGNNGILYLDRFLVTTFLGLEATGVYTFFWSITNAVNSLIFFGVTSPMAPKIIATVKRGNKLATAIDCKAMLKEIGWWCFGLSMALFVSMPWVLQYLGNHKFDEYKAVFSVMLLATLLRTVSEGADNILYAHHQEHKMAMISLSAMVVSAVCLSILAPVFGLMGVAFAMCVVAGYVFLMRGIIARNLIY
jgi:O-antigen/teichoic acid export membrane protein